MSEQCAGESGATCRKQIANCKLQIANARVRRVAIVLAFALLQPGCQDELGTGGTGELVVPHEQLRRIESLDLRKSISTTNPTTQPVGPPPPEVKLGIEECRRLALQNNLDLRVTLFNPAVARTSLSEAEAQFEAVFFGSANGTTARSPAIRGPVGPRIDNIVTDAGLEIPLRTGGSIRLDLPTDVVHTHLPSPPPETLWNPNPSFSLSQPLLRGGGLYVATQGIRLAFYEYERSQAMTKLEVTRVLADVDRAYWQLFAAREELKVRKKQYDSAVAQLERARRQARAGTVADVDVVRAESGVADTVDSVITAENNVRTRERALKRMLNEPTLPLNLPTTIVPATDPAAFPYDLDVDRLTSAALHQRMEMLDQELQVAQQTANVRFARANLLPLVALQYTYSRAGAGHTAGPAFSQVWERNSAEHQVGLQLQVPLGNEAARSELRRAMLQRMQALASREQQALQIRQEIADAADTLRTNWQRIVAARERVVLSARTLGVEVRQFGLGLRTSTDVLIAESDLAAAELTEVSAVSDYQVAQVDMAFATGTVLGAAHVDWQPVAQPDVPRY